MSEQEPAANAAFTSEVVYQLPYNGEIREGIAFGDDSQILDIYYPETQTGPYGVVVFVMGFSDQAFGAIAGKHLKNLPSYKSWARLVAARGLVGVLYTTVEPVSDSLCCIEYLQAHASELNIEGNSIGLWACSGNVPNAIHLLNSKQGIDSAVLCYGFMLDLNGSTGVRDAAAQFPVVNPNNGAESFPEGNALMVVRAGKDEFAGITEGIEAFVAEGRARNSDLEFIDYSDGVHSFDVLDSSPQSIEIVKRMLQFLESKLKV